MVEVLSLLHMQLYEQVSAAATRCLVFIGVAQAAAHLAARSIVDGRGTWLTDTCGQTTGRTVDADMSSSASV